MKYEDDSSPRIDHNLLAEEEAIRAKCFHPSGTFVKFPKEDVETSIPARFEKIVRMYPDRLAVKMGDHALTYKELSGAANRIAHAILETRGPGSEPIALLFEHGIDVIAAIFGVLKAGKFFVALNPAFPEQRNLRALEDSGAPLILINRRHKALVEILGCGLSLEIEALGENYPLDSVLYHPGDIAVLTYTSGSTDQPKGVVQTHQHLLHSFRIQADEMRITIHDRVSLLHSLSFATAYSNLMAALLSGAALFPVDMKALDPGGFARWISDQNITVLHLPPTSFRQFAESIGAKNQLHRLKLIRLSGVPITRRDFEALPDPGQSRPELDTHYVTATTPVEEQLAKIWAEVLSLDQVGIHDNFFELGGHSLAATRVVSQVIKRFQMEVPLQSLFHSPTVAEMAAVIIKYQGEKIGEKDLESILAELESMSEEEALKSMAKEFADRRSTPPNHEL